METHRKTDENKTVCFFSGDISRSGGTERVASMIANGLCRRGNFRIVILSLVQKQEPFFEIDGRICCYALGEKWIQPGPGYLRLLPKLRHFLKEQKVDVIVDIDIVLDVLSIPAARRLPVRVISWEHFNYFGEQKVLYRRLILKYSVKRSDYVVTLTERDKENYAAYLGRTKRIAAIHNPMEQRDTPEGKKEKWIISVGSLSRTKGMDYLAETAVSVLHKHPDWKWLVLGEGDMREYLEEQVRTAHLEEQLILKGNVKNVFEYLQKAQIFVLTSRFEGLPMCLLEAKACRLPCVSFDIMTGPSEIIRDRENGFLVSPYDCGAMAERINLLIENEDLRTHFTQQTVLDVEKFQIEEILGKWERLL